MPVLLMLRGYKRKELLLFLRKNTFAALACSVVMCRCVWMSLGELKEMREKEKKRDKKINKEKKIHSDGQTKKDKDKNKGKQR